MSLYIYAENQNVRTLLHDQLQSHRWTDSGFDVPMLARDFFDEIGELGYPHLNYGLKLGVKVAAVNTQNEPVPCLLLPRSSIGRSSFRITNSIGLIDAGYRGEVQAKVDVVDVPSPWESGNRFFQLCQHNFLPWRNIFIVNSADELPAAPDNRGEGGFGSTGR